MFCRFQYIDSAFKEQIGLILVWTIILGALMRYSGAEDKDIGITTGLPFSVSLALSPVVIAST